MSGGIRLSDEATKEIREFVEELTVIARSGQSISIISGYHLAWWGGVVAVCCLINLLAVEYSLPLHDQYIWPVAICLGWFGSRYVSKMMRDNGRTGKRSFANQVAQRVWLAIGVTASLIIFVEASQIVSFAGRGYFIIFTLCAIGLVTTAAVANEPLLGLSGAGWFASGAITLFFVPSASLVYAVTVIACIIFLVIPGLIIGFRQA